jgi:hypothetical protein
MPGWLARLGSQIMSNTTPSFMRQKKSGCVVIPPINSLPTNQLASSSSTALLLVEGYRLFRPPTTGPTKYYKSLKLGSQIMMSNNRTKTMHRSNDPKSKEKQGTTSIISLQ